MSDVQDGAPDTGASDGLDFDGIESFELGDDGSLQPTFSASEEDSETPETVATETPATKQDDKPAEPAHDWEKRYSDLRPEFDRVTQANAAMRRELDYLKGAVDTIGRAGQKEKDTQAEPEVDYLELISDPKRAQQHFNTLVEQAVQERLKEYEPHFIELELGREVRDAASKYPDFFEMRPHMQKVFETFPDEDITFDRAYQIAKRFVATNPSPAEADKGKVDLTALKSKAARVNPESGVAGAAVEAEPAKPAVGSLEDAFNLALRQATGRK